MAGDIKLADIKKTQDILGKYVKRPPLTEKLLRKPPFRFLHDIITTVVRETKFFGGLFTDDEMNSENVTDKERKMAFLQKVIDVVNIACGVSLSVRPSKVVAGYEPEKTNELLQVIGKAVQKKVDSSEAVKIVLSKSKGSSKEQTNEHQPQIKKEEVVKSKKAAAPPEKRRSKDKEGNDIPKQHKATPRVEEKDKKPAIREDKKNPATTSKDKRPKKSNDKPVPAAKDATKTESKGHTSKERKKTADDLKPEGNSKRSSLGGKANNGESSGSVRGQSNGNNSSSSRTEEVVPKGPNKDGRGVVEKVQNKLSLEANDVEVEEAFPSLEPPVSDERENPQGLLPNAAEPPNQLEDGDKPGSAKKSHPNGGCNKAQEDVRATMNSGQRMAIATPVVRPSSVMSLASSRPKSSRPRAPRLRSALGGLIPADDVDRGKVEQMEGGTGDVDAKEFLVEEARPPSLREAKLAAGGGDEVTTMGEEGGEKQQGLLVAKILETKKELEAGIEEESGPLKRVEIEYGEDEIKRRRRGAGEVETLQSLVQSIARAAHPLGSLLGMLQENVEALRSETSKWRTECDHLVKLLREEEKQMEVQLEPLRSVLSEVERSVVEEREAVSAAKVRLLKAEQRIQIMLDPKGSTVSHRIPTQVS